MSCVSLTMLQFNNVFFLLAVAQSVRASGSNLSYVFRPFFWSSPKSGQKKGLNLSEDLFFGLHLSHLVFIFQSKFLATRLPFPPFRKSCARHWNRGRQAISLGPYPARDLKDPSEIPYVTSGSRWPGNQILL